MPHSELVVAHSVDNVSLWCLLINLLRSPRLRFILEDGSLIFCRSSRFKVFITPTKRRLLIILPILTLMARRFTIASHIHVQWQEQQITTECQVELISGWTCFDPNVGLAQDSVWSLVRSLVTSSHSIHSTSQILENSIYACEQRLGLLIFGREKRGSWIGKARSR